MANLVSDIRYAVRALLRDPGYTSIAVVTLALGIAVNTVIFSLVDAVLVRPLAYREPGRLVVVNEVVPEIQATMPLLPVNARHYFEWRDRAQSFADMGILLPMDFLLTRAGDPELLRGAHVSGSLLPMLGVRPQIGRLFDGEDDQPDHNRVVLISDSLWQRRFQRDKAVIGRSITLDGVPHVVVGVLPPSFGFPHDEMRGGNLPHKADVFRPIAFRREAVEWFGDFNYTVIGRLKPGVSIERARSELNVIQADLVKFAGQKMHLAATVAGLQDEVVGETRAPLLILLAAVAAVLLIACANLANLALARGAARGREVAIRSALGASRLTLIRGVLVESLCVGAAGGAIGMALAWAGSKVILANAPLSLPRLDEVQIDARAVLVAAGLSLATGLLCGIIPAWRASNAQPLRWLGSASRSMTEGRSGLRTRNALVALECALGVALLVVAGLLVGSFARLIGVDKGFSADHIVTAQITLPEAGYAKPEDRAQYYTALIERLRAIPGVTTAAFVTKLPLEGEGWVDAMQREGEHRPIVELPPTNYRGCSPDYFKAMGIPFVAGRAFTEADRARSLVVISETAARKVWPNENPIGRKFDRGFGEGELFEVAGVVHDVRVGMDQQPVLTVYVPYWFRPRLAINAVLRTSIDPASVGRPIRAAVWSVDRDSVVGAIRTMDEVVSSSVAQRRFQMVLTAAFALFALLLACIGIYGVVGWSVRRRRHEIGIRLALGAQPREITRMVIAQGMQPVAAGITAGVVIALALGRIVRTVLFGVSPHDPVIIAAVSLALAAVAALACYLPARRATVADPLGVLREE